MPTGILEQSRLPLANRTGLFGGIGHSVSVLGDLDGNGYIDLTLGSNGSAFVALMVNGSHAGAQVLSLVEHTGASIHPSVESSDGFGLAVSAVRGLGNNSDFIDVLVGAPGAQGGRGAAFLLFLRTNGSVYNFTKRIASGESGFSGVLSVGDSFGASLSGMGDFNSDGYPDVCVGAPGDSSGGVGLGAGAVWLLGLDSVGWVVS